MVSRQKTTHPFAFIPLLSSLPLPLLSSLPLPLLSSLLLLLLSFLLFAVCRCLCRCLFGCHPAGICFCLCLCISFSPTRNPVISTGAAHALVRAERRNPLLNPDPSHPRCLSAYPARQKISTEIFQKPGMFSEAKNQPPTNHTNHTFYRVLTTKNHQVPPIFRKTPRQKSPQKKSQDQHAIPIREKPIPLPNRMSISSQNRLPTCKRTDQHKQRRLRQMEVSQQPTNNPKPISRTKEDTRRARMRLQPHTSMRLKPKRMLRTMLQRARGCSPRRNDPPALSQRSIHGLGRSSRQRVMLRMKTYIFNIFRTHRLKRPKPNMQRNRLDLHTTLTKLGKNLRRKVKSRSRRSR